MSYKLLICDDERMIREGILHAVDWPSIGIGTVATAKDGEEGWSWAREHRPELVITDIRMPKLDGLELLNRIMLAFPYTKVILLTGHGEFEYAQQAIRGRAFDYVLKPTNPEALITVCTFALEELSANAKRTVLATEEEKDESERLIQQIVRYVQEHFKEQITLETAAKQVHLSTVHLNRVLKKEMGTTFLEYLTHVRIEEAKRLLLSTRLTVHEISFDVGYRDPKYFSQLFRKMTGSKPSEYAEDVRGNSGESGRKVSP
ncbi:response regulator transcription factor [Cohnella candidum]|nr:response regulator [Cohnella candidum]